MVVQMAECSLFALERLYKILSLTFWSDLLRHDLRSDVRNRTSSRGEVKAEEGASQRVRSNLDCVGKQVCIY